jgi:hypothetical protein
MLIGEEAARKTAGISVSTSLIWLRSPRMSSATMSETSNSRHDVMLVALRRASVQLRADEED